MNLDNTQFDSPKKETKRSSILKHRTDNKECNKQELKGLSTTVRHSVRFKEQPQQQNNVRDFNESNRKQEREKSQRNIFQNEQVRVDKSYSKQSFSKAVNNINYLYSNVLMMATSNCKKMSEKAEQKQLVQLNKAIHQMIQENKKLKQEIGEKHKKQNDLHQLSEYLNCSIEELINKDKLQLFIEDYLSKQQEWDEFQKRCKDIDENSQKKTIGFNQAYINQKQKKCQALRKKIEREKNAIKKLQKQEAQLLKHLYRGQKEIMKNQRLSSALKLKINQIQIDNEYRLSKTKAKSICKKTLNKENVEPGGELKHAKINNKQNLKSKVSLAKLLKKQ